MVQVPGSATAPGWRVWLGWVGTLVFLGLACQQVNLGAVWRHILAANPLGLGLAALALLFAYGLRTLRWQACFRDPKSLHPRLLAQVLMVGYLGNNLLPARAGEALRVYWLNRHTGRDPALILATIVLERVVDGLVLSAALGCGLLIHPQGVPWQFQGLVILFVVTGILGIGLMWWGSRIRAGLVWPGSQLWVRLIEAAAQVGDQLAAVVALSLGVWAVEAVGFAGMFMAFHLPGQFEYPVLGMAVANFASLIPAAPAAWGSLEHFTSRFLVQMGLDPDPVLGMVLSQHLLYFGITTGLGLWSWVALHVMNENTPAPERLSSWQIYPPGIPRPHLSIIIPAKDEAERLPKTLQEILVHPWDMNYEIWVVDDGSKDTTAEWVKTWQADYPQVGLLSYQPNRGKGHALRQGILQARGEVILLVDADGATPIAEIGRLWPHLSAANRIVIGSRVLQDQGTAVKTLWHRKLIGWVFVRLVQWLVIEGIYDTQCGFKLLEAGAAQDIARHLTLDGFGVDVELLMIAKRRQYGIREIGINWVNQPGSKVRVIRDGFKMLLEILRIRWQASQGVYERALTQAQNRESVPQ